MLLGTIFSSAINYDNLCHITNDPQVIDNQRTHFVPCDGRPISGSKLSRITGLNNVPDLRGRFLRGLNLIYSIDEPEFKAELANPDDPERNRKIGDYQSDDFRRHTHGTKKTPKNKSGAYGTDISLATTYELSNTYTDGDQAPKYPKIGYSGDASETRPKNISVFFYIKIND